jgi:hypothetical protein
MDPSSLTPEDEIFLKEMECLNIHRALRIKVVAARETVVRAAEKTPSRLQNHAARDAELNQRIEEEAAQARQREYWREQMRLAEEKRRKDMLEREEMERHERQRAREVWEAKRKQEAEIEARQHWEREEVSRVATERAYAAQVYAIDQEYQVYDTKWAQLRSGVPLDPINFCELPWPVLGPRVARPSDITYQRVQDFVFNTLRKGVEDKSRREKVRLEVLKWHPDKFDTKVLLKVVDHERQVTAEAAGIVVRILMQIMEEEVAREHDP